MKQRDLIKKLEEGIIIRSELYETGLSDFYGEYR